jgi:hypothetical protein
MIIDGSRVIDEDSGYKMYFKAFIINESGKQWDEVTNYEVKRNQSTRTLDFSGTNSGYSVRVGFVILNGTSLVGAIAYTNAKLTLSSSSSAPQLSGDMANLNLNAITENDLKTIISEIKKSPSTVYKKAPLLKNSK